MAVAFLLKPSVWKSLKDSFWKIASETENKIESFNLPRETQCKLDKIKKLDEIGQNCKLDEIEQIKKLDNIEKCTKLKNAQNWKMHKIENWTKLKKLMVKLKEEGSVRSRLKIYFWPENSNEGI